MSGADAPATAATLATLVHGSRIAGVQDATPAFEKILIEFSDVPTYAAHIDAFLAWADEQNLSAVPDPRVHTIRVRYDGEDLDYVAKRAGLSTDEVVALHCTPVYSVALLGFSPGFPYLEGLDPRIHTPRRDTPRPGIPPGSVAIGGSHTGIYSLPTPGGWNLIGTTDTRLFDLTRCDEAGDPEAAFLFRTGDHVRFLAI